MPAFGPGSPGNDPLYSTLNADTGLGLGGNDTLTVNYNYVIPSTSTTPPVGAWNLFGGSGTDTLIVDADIDFGSNPSSGSYQAYTASANYSGDSGSDTINGKIWLNKNPGGVPFGNGSTITQVVTDVLGSNTITLDSFAETWDDLNVLTHQITTGIYNDTITSITESEGYNWNGVSNVTINAGDGTNKITVLDTSGNLTLDVTSGSGVDTLTVNMSGDNGNEAGILAQGTVSLGGGNDIANILLGGGSDAISAADFDIDLGAGNDKLTLQGFGGTYDVIGGGGSDTITMTFNAGDYTTGVHANVNGGNGNNIINLTMFNEDYVPAQSYATVMTYGGVDTINLTNGHGSTVNSGGGNDTILGAGFSETINAGNGNDKIGIRLGNDTVTGGTGADNFRFIDDGNLNNNPDWFNWVENGDTHTLTDLDFALGDTLTFTGDFGTGPGSFTFNSLLSLSTFDVSNTDFTYTPGSLSNGTTYGDTITFTDSNSDLVTIYF